MLGFEIECEKTEPEIYTSEHNSLRKKLQSINFGETKNFEVVLALANNKVVGELSIGYYFDYERNCKVGVIPGLWVLKPYRMAGIGRSLIDFAKKRLKELGFRRIELIVGLGNLAGIEFYKNLGFKIRKVGQVILEL
jgi:ribosomal protein S18 acetylase RimI-like enzyme